MKADVLRQILRRPLAVWESSGLHTSSSRSSRRHTVCTACWEDPTRTTGLTGRLQQRGDLLDVQKKKYVKITYTTHMGLFTTVSQTDNRPDTKHKLKSYGRILTTAALTAQSFLEASGPVHARLVTRSHDLVGVGFGAGGREKMCHYGI